MRMKLAQVLGTGIVLAIFVAIVVSHHSVEATGTKTAPLHDEAVSRSIRSVLSGYATSLVAGNIDAWTALWDEEATWLPSNEPASVGKASIERALRTSLEHRAVLGMSISVRDVSTDGDIAVAMGDFTETIEVAGERGFTTGQFLTVFRRQHDGSWKIYQSCLNVNTTGVSPPV